MKTSVDRMTSTGATGRAHGSGRAAEAAMYLAAAAVALGVILFLTRPWIAGIDVPLNYGADSLLSGTGVKSIVTTGRWLENPSLGAPGTMNTYETPGADLIANLMVLMLGLASSDWATVLNCFYLLGYPLTAIVAVFALRRMGRSRLVAATGASLFALLPYHWMRGESHLLLATYWVVPLVALVAMWMDSDAPPLLRLREPGLKPGWALLNNQSVASIVICAAAAASGVYYAFFGAAFIVFASTRSAVRHRAYRILAAGLTLAVGMGVVAALQVTPNVLAMRDLGPNPAGVARNPGQAEVYGLKVTQLFLPIDGHRLSSFASLKAMYRDGLRQMGPYLDNEANMASLGLLLSAGLLVSLLLFVFRAPPRTEASSSFEVRAAESAGFLSMCALLLATVGGFGAMLAVVLPQIRAYNRISVFIAFFALAALAALVDRALVGLRGYRRVLGGGLVVVVALLAILDQTPVTLQTPAEKVASYREEQAFGEVVSGLLPAGTMVFQLPYMPFPEPGGPVGQMQDYDPLRAYLQTEGLRWSYGATKGRADDEWQRTTAALPAARLVREAKERGFGALWVQLDGYPEGGEGLRSELEEVLGPPDLLRDDGVIALWEL